VNSRRTTLVLCGVFATAAGAGSQQSTPSPGEFRYTPGQLDCAVFREWSRAQLDAQTGLRQRREMLTRDGIWRMRARPGPGGIAVEAWYDSLALSRTSPEGKLVPDTDGLLGGRYRGALSPAGRYTAQARPFVPDDVAEVAELGGAMEDLLPPLPPVAISVGQRWSDSSGLELRRLPDSVAGRHVVRRLAVHVRTVADQATVRGDTMRLPVRQVTVEDGRIDWDPAIGLVSRVRRLVVETSVPAGGPLRQPLRSRLEQEETLVRVGARCAESP
jgi:hypothetical protein